MFLTRRATISRAFIALLLLWPSFGPPNLPQPGERVIIVGAGGTGSATAGEDYLYLRYYWFCLEYEAFDAANRVQDDGWLTDLAEGDSAEVRDVDIIDDARSMQPDLVKVKMLDGTHRGQTFWVSLVSVKRAGK